MLKRVFDLGLICLTAFLVVPVLTVLTILVWLLIGRPVFFRQTRPGFKGQPFQLYKFRTMLNTRDSDGNLLPDAERLCRFGKILRSTSLDELPELYNVLKGEMSLVGPRPLLMEYLDLYTANQAKRHDVLPGITGWAQINGRNAISWEERFQLDLWYVDHRSMWLDIKILIMTFSKILRREGVSAEGHVTMPKFTGSKP